MAFMSPTPAVTRTGAPQARCSAIRVGAEASFENDGWTMQRPTWGRHSRPGISAGCAEIIFSGMAVAEGSHGPPERRE